MFIKKIIFIVLILLSLFVSGCKEREFIPPNKDNITTGSVEKIAPVGTVLKLTDYAKKMAQLWDTNAVLISVNGIDIGIDGYNKATFNGSRWIYTYFSSSKSPDANTYNITFSGTGTISWLQTGSDYDVKNNIENFSIDSSKAMLLASKAGQKEGKIYTLELQKNDKGMLWVIGSKETDNTDKYDIKKIDAISGDVVN